MLFIAGPDLARPIVHRIPTLFANKHVFQTVHLRPHVRLSPPVLPVITPCGKIVPLSYVEATMPQHASR